MCKGVKENKKTQFYDLLACNIYSNPDWVYAIEKLEDDCGMEFRASSDVTGWGGNWILETDNVDLTTIYFTGLIYQWQYTLASTISTNTTITQSFVDTSSNWPVTIGTSGVTVTFASNLTFSYSTAIIQYFIIGATNVTIDGSGYVVTLTNLVNYTGLVQNCSSSSVAGYNNATVQNIGVISSGTTTLAQYGGWIGQRYFGSGSSSGTSCRNNVINNCYSTGIMSNQSSGGILGQWAGSYYGQVYVSNCYSTGTITRYNGGICGESCGAYSYGQIYVTNCYSTGLCNGEYSGGILGPYSGQSNGYACVTNCYSTGNLTGGSTGGIIGGYGGSYGGCCYAINCYSTGTISGYEAGGICGAYSGSLYNGYAYAINCYSTGAISAQNGGIFGRNCGGGSYSSINTTTVRAINCYVVSSTNAAIYGSSSVGNTTTNCVTATTWTDASANSVLTGVTDGSTWFNVTSATNQNYLLSTNYKTALVTAQSWGSYSGTDITNISFVPGAPTINSIYVGNSKAIITFTNTTPNYLPPTGYYYSLNDGADSAFISISTLNDQTITKNNTITITGITNNTSYTVKIKLVNTSGIGSYSTNASFTPISKSTISSSKSFTQNDVVAYTWPITIDTSGVTLTFASNVILTTTQYFIIAANNINIDGAGYTIAISDWLDYLGLVRNGTSSIAGYNNVTIQNIGVFKYGTSSLGTHGGWVCQPYFGAGLNVTTVCTDNIITNCYSNGNIGTGSIYGGGICGSYAAARYGNVIANACYATGNLTQGGGIYGANAGYTGGTVTANDCYYGGSINYTQGGGIFGTFASGICNANRCFYNNLNALQAFCGGIFGAYISSTCIATATNCYSTGTSGQRSGGIFGAYAAGTCYAINCYNTGAISSGTLAGGIFGYNAGTGSGQCYATNCYSTGTINDVSGGGIFGGLALGTTSATNCYVVSSINSQIYGNGPTGNTTTNCLTATSWADLSANSILTGTADGSSNIWLNLDLTANATTERYLLTSTCTTELITRFTTLATATTAFQALSGYSATAPAITSNSGTTITFTPATCSKNVITNYKYSVDNGTTWSLFYPVLSASSTTASIPRLTSGQNIKIRAVDVVDGPASASYLVVGVPSAPTGLSPTAGNATVSVAFTAGADGGSAITNYKYSTDNGTSWTTRTDGQTTSSPVVITKLSSNGTTNLTNGTTYTILLQAVNAIGDGIASSSVSGTPRTIPSAPTGLSATPGNLYVSVAFTAGATGGSAITNYKYSTDNGTSWITRTDGQTISSPIVITMLSIDGTTNLSNGTQYTILLKAVNVLGDGTTSSSVSVIPYPAFWLDNSLNTNLIKSLYIKGFVDVSGGDIVNRNGNLNITGNSTLVGNVYIGGDMSLNGRLFSGGDTSMNGRLYVAGGITTTSFTNTSDYRVKQNVQSLADLQFTVDALRPVYYDNQLTNKPEFGLIAHEVQQIFPFAVNGIKDGPEYQSVNYIELLGLLIHEIQNLKKVTTQLTEQLLPLVKETESGAPADDS